MSKKTEGTRPKRSRTTWWNCVKDDMKHFGLSCDDAQDKNDWRMRINLATS